MPLRSIALLAVLVATAGCGPERAELPPRLGDALPEFSASRLDGGEVSLASYEGRPVLVNLWATWCAPCREEMPYLESVSRTYGPSGLRVIGISTDHAGALDQVRTVVRERGVTYDVLLDPGARSTDLFGVFGLPVTFLADADGIVTWMTLGPIREGDTAFEAALEALTAGSPALEPR